MTTRGYLFTFALLLFAYLTEVDLLGSQSRPAAAGSAIWSWSELEAAPTQTASRAFTLSTGASPTFKLTQQPKLTLTPVLFLPFIQREGTPPPAASPTPMPAGTPTASATDLPDPTSTPTGTATATDLPDPTSTPTDTPTATDLPDPTSTPTGTPTATDLPDPTSTPTDTPTATDLPDPTSAPTGTATDLPDPTSTPGSTPNPDLGTNWLTNGQFENFSFLGWHEVNGYWSGTEAVRSLHDPLSCSPSGTFYLQMDRDSGPNAWPSPPSEDWAWQDVQSPGPHSVLYLHYEEAHHMHDGIIELTIYGRTAGGSWETIFHQNGVQSPFGTGKCSLGMPPATYNFEIPVNAAYDEYRLEVHGKMLDPDDAVLWGDFRLWGG